jgi:hypothetical protein
MTACAAVAVKRRARLAIAAERRTSEASRMVA